MKYTAATIASNQDMSGHRENGEADRTIRRRATIFANSPKIAPFELDCRSDALVSDDRALRVSGWPAADYSARLFEALECPCDPRKPGVS